MTDSIESVNETVFKLARPISQVVELQLLRLNHKRQMINWLTVLRHHTDPLLHHTATLLKVNTSEPQFAFFTPAGRLVVVINRGFELTVQIYEGHNMYQLSLLSYDNIALQRSSTSLVESDQPLTSRLRQACSKSWRELHVTNVRSGQYYSPGELPSSDTQLTILLSGTCIHHERTYGAYLEVKYDPQCTDGSSAITLGDCRMYSLGKVPRFVLLPRGYAVLTERTDGLELYQAYMGRAVATFGHRWRTMFYVVSTQRLAVSVESVSGQHIVVFDWSEQLTVGLIVRTYRASFDLLSSPVALDGGNLVVNGNASGTSVYDISVDTGGEPVELAHEDVGGFNALVYHRSSGIMIGHGRSRKLLVAAVESYIDMLGLQYILDVKRVGEQLVVVSYDYPTTRVDQVQLCTTTVH